jgi:arginase
MLDIKLLGIPFDFGQDHMGVRMACQYLVNNGLIQRLTKAGAVNDLGEINFPFKQTAPLLRNMKSLKQASAVNQQISEVVSELNLSQSFLLSIGGDHGLALGSIHGILTQNPNTIVIWADAHGDLNTPSTSPSSNFHGMALAFLLQAASDKDFHWLKHRLKPQQLILIGSRDLDLGERDLIDQLSLQYYSSEDLNGLGAKDLLDMALHKADPLGRAPIHLSFDVDIFDKKDLSSTGTQVEGGPRLEEIFLMGGILAETGRLKSMDVVEFNPLIGNEAEVHRSSELILDFLESTLLQVCEAERTAHLRLNHHFDNNHLRI